MYVHKYIVDSDTIYRVTSDSAKPGTISLKQADWIGRIVSTGKAENALNIIEKAFREPKKEPEKESKKASISNVLHNFAQLMNEE